MKVKHNLMENDPEIKSIIEKAYKEADEILKIQKRKGIMGLKKIRWIKINEII